MMAQFSPQLRPRSGGGLSRQAAERQADSAGRSVARRTAPRSGTAEWAAVPALHHRLDDIRLHADAEGAHMAEEEHARAVTIGRDIYFNRGAYDPDTAEGQGLLAHELVHAAQQADGTVPPSPQHQPKGETRLGLGSAPPDVEFTRAEGPANEQEHVQFPYDSDKLSPSDSKKAQSWAKSQFIPVIVELHGYASHEGPDQYNVNLSAHRAAAVKFVIEPLLPLGSRVELIAHGESGGFKLPEDNRRVGMTARMKPLEVTPPPIGQGGFGLGQRRPAPGLLGPGLQPPVYRPPPILDPRVLFPPGSQKEPQPAVDVTTPLPTPYQPKPPAWTLPQLYHFPAGPPEPYWPGLADPFTERGLSMGKGDADVLSGLATQNLGLLNLTEGLYGPPYNWARRTFPFLSLDPLDVAKPQWAASLAGSAAGSSLERDFPTPLESFNKEGAKFGFPEPTFIPTPSFSFDLNSAAVKKSQEDAKRREEEAKKKKGNE